MLSHHCHRRVTLGHENAHNSEQWLSIFHECLYSLKDAFRCIAQPNTALVESMLCLMQYLYDPGYLFTKLCKSGYPCESVSEIQPIKGVYCVHHKPDSLCHRPQVIGHKAESHRSVANSWNFTSAPIHSSLCNCLMDNLLLKAAQSSTSVWISSCSLTSNSLLSNTFSMATQSSSRSSSS